MQNIFRLDLYKNRRHLFFQILNIFIFVFSENLSAMRKILRSKKNLKSSSLKSAAISCRFECLI